MTRRQTGTTRRRARAPWIGAVIVLFFVASCIQGPITGPGAPALPGTFDVSTIGYQQSEYFLGGLANAYTPTTPLTSDGKWQVATDPANSGVAFKTRLVVHRPLDPAKFNGTVVVEWLNVTAGVDLPNDWILAHNELVRAGTVWVGVSAQARGLNQLKACCDARYGSLSHPGDSFSYDMFTWAGKVIRDNPTVLGGLTPQRVLAVGESQSASRLVTYINAVHPLAQAYDGFLVHSRGVSGSALAQTPLTPVPTPSPTLIRDDLAEPVFVVQAEGDVISSNLAVRQPDTPKFRQWEMAGTSHADAYLLGVGFSDTGDGSGAVQMFALMRNPNPAPGGCTSPINAGPHHWILQAAFHGLDAWVQTGTAPAVGPLLDVDSTSPVVLARDAQGNALGGVRSPHVDAPVATITGLNSGPGFCRLFGSTTPLTTGELTALYPTHEAFVHAWIASLVAALAGGFLLPADAYELLVAGVSSQIPN